MSHDSVLRSIGAGGTVKTVNRILSVWANRTASDLESGARWYAEDADAILQGLVDAGAQSREHAAAAIAHMSPRTTWSRNTVGAMILVTDGPDAAKRFGCMGAGVDRASVALTSDDPISTLNGPKTRRFALNLLGDREAVTVDVWACRVAFPADVDGEKLLGRKGVYDAVEHCFRLAARRAGVDPTTMQATTWITARGGRAA